MVCTGSHNRSISDHDYVQFGASWAEFIEQDITVWKDFHEFWINAKIPVHIIRYEDIVATPEPALRSLLEFILNVDSIAGTKVEQNLQLAVSEASPQIYKPREGKINGNVDKFNKDSLHFVMNYAEDFIKLFNYMHIFKKDVEPSSFMETFNKSSHKKSVKAQNEDEEITSIYINYPALLLRKKSELYPTGRTSHKFK
jgi:hypothetical protein